MNKTQKFLAAIPAVRPSAPASPERSQEESYLLDARLSQKNKNLGKEQDMSRRSTTVRQTIAQVKNALGHRARTHYRSMLAYPSTKLQPFLFPGMTVDQLKSLAKVLSTAEPKQRSQLKKEAPKPHSVRSYPEIDPQSDEEITGDSQLYASRERGSLL